MSRLKERKVAAVQALIDLKKYLGMDQEGLDLLRSVEEYVKDLRQEVCSVRDQFGRDLLELQAAKANCVKYTTEIAEYEILFDKYTSHIRTLESLTKDLAEKLMEAREGYANIEPDEILEVIYKMMCRYKNQMLVAVDTPIGLEVRTTFGKKGHSLGVLADAIEELRERERKNGVDKHEKVR